MNPLEYASKTMILYSLRKNERIDLSCLPDEVFDMVLYGLWETKMCVEGGEFTGKYVKSEAKSSKFVELLRRTIVPRYPRINRLIAYIEDLKDGEVFRIVSNDAPTLNKQLAVFQTNAMALGLDDKKVHDSYLLRWGRLSTSFRHFAYGYDGIRVAVGEANKQKRICRFCGRSVPEVAYNSVAHAIPEGLGNKLLFCNEECDECNNKLSKTESNLMHYLDVRRAIGGILSKTDSTVPSVDGKDFVIRGNEKNQAVIYLEEESLLGIDCSQPFWKKLETEEIITHQGIYKSLCKIVIDLLPDSELHHFAETIGWINGSVMDTELPPYFASYGGAKVIQPTADIFLSNRPGLEPYCTAVVHLLDVLFIFILPEVDVDKAQFKTETSISFHIQKMMKAWGGSWNPEDSSDYNLANPWVNLLIDPNSQFVQIRLKSDPIFMRYNRKEDDKNEKVFPPFVPDGISQPVITNVKFKRLSLKPVSVDELHQVSVNYGEMVCTLQKTTSSAHFSLAFNFSDSSNRISYFDFGFEADVKLLYFDRYIEIGDYFSIDYHLRDYLCRIIMAAANNELHRYTANSDLAPVTLLPVLDRRTIRHLFYKVEIGDGRYLIIKDAKLHNL